MGDRIGYSRGWGVPPKSLMYSDSVQVNLFRSAAKSVPPRTRPLTTAKAIANIFENQGANSSSGKNHRYVPRPSDLAQGAIA